MTPNKQQHNKNNQGGGNRNNTKSTKKNRNDRTFGGFDPEMSKDFDFEKNNRLFDKGVSSSIFINNKQKYFENFLLRNDVAS